MFLETFMRLVPSTSSTSTTANRQGRSSMVTLKLMRICLGGCMSRPWAMLPGKDGFLNDDTLRCTYRCL